MSQLITTWKDSKLYGFDVETLGTGPGCVIVSAAFLVFDFDEEKTFQDYVNEALYLKFNIRDQKEKGRHIDPDTLEWWKKQTDDVRRALMPSANDVTLEKGAALIEQYLADRGIHQANDKRVWRFCRGQDFDIPIMSEMMQSVGKKLPGSYWNSRDIRTFISAILMDLTTTTLYKDDREYKTLPGFVMHDARHDIAKAVVEMKACAKLVTNQMSMDDL